MKKDGDALDADLEALEGVVLACGSFTDEQISKASESSAAMVQLIKRGNKTMQAMKPWFKLS